MSEYSLRLGEAVLRSRMREAEQVARLEGEIATRVKSEFISNMSHELRTPLNTVIGFSKLLTEHGQGRIGADEVVEYARLIQDAAANLLSIINDILDMSKIQAGHYNLDMIDVNLDEVLEAVVASQRGAASFAGVKLNLAMPDEQLTLKGDPQKLRQIFNNLISNAVKFSTNGGTVDVIVELTTDSSILVTVHDTGIGIDAEELEIALSPFGQVDASKSRSREGTGLGLPIAKALIELHGGELILTSEKSKGTDAKVKFPTRELISLIAKDIGISPGIA
ncbi:MAG: sensor histidine kinase [Hyphomicrobiaceae bacterium]